MSQSSRSKASIALAAGVVAVSLSGRTARAAFDVVEKDIPQLESAYASGAATVSDIVNQYLNRISTYDDGPNGVNAVGQINPDLAAQVAATQALINSSGPSIFQSKPLLGVPILIKDSYDVQGMITTNGVSVLNGSGTPGSTTLNRQDRRALRGRAQGPGRDHPGQGPT